MRALTFSVLAMCGVLAQASLAQGQARYQPAPADSRQPYQPGVSHTLYPLPMVEGVVPWETLGMIDKVFEGVDLVPVFAPQVEALDGKIVRMVGFLMPLDARGTKLLLSIVSPNCPFCIPAGASQLVELLAPQRIDFSESAVVVEGKFEILRDAYMSAYYYRMNDARVVDIPAS